VVAKGRGEPVGIETIVVPDPGPGEAVVAVQACGVCHTDLHYREGGINDDFPFLLGHEAAGVVESVGPDVTDRGPGDFVVLNWRAVCGTCRSCLRANPSVLLHVQRHPEDDPHRRHAPVAGARHRRLRREDPGGRRPVHTGRPGASPAAAGLLGCGVMAGLGASMLTGERAARRLVAVFGCGGVGDAAIMGARLAGATTIVAVDLDDRKLEWARSSAPPTP
jgi:S-(hydroxymethyl)mycothiol dehydrogenase